jgi:hypothetical protein
MIRLSLTVEVFYEDLADGQPALNKKILREKIAQAVRDQVNEITVSIHTCSVCDKGWVGKGINSSLDVHLV